MPYFIFTCVKSVTESKYLPKWIEMKMVQKLLKTVVRIGIGGNKSLIFITLAGRLKKWWRARILRIPEGSV